MMDRVSANPGRMLITPEDGSAPFYATLSMADNPTVLGTPLNKASLLTDATAALFGLGTDAVPDDVLEKISKSSWRVCGTAAIDTLSSGDSFDIMLSDPIKPFDEVKICVYGGPSDGTNIYVYITSINTILNAPSTSTYQKLCIDTSSALYNCFLKFTVSDSIYARTGAQYANIDYFMATVTNTNVTTNVSRFFRTNLLDRISFTAYSGGPAQNLQFTVLKRSVVNAN